MEPWMTFPALCVVGAFFFACKKKRGWEDLFDGVIALVFALLAGLSVFFFFLGKSHG